MADYFLVERGKGPAWDHDRGRREQDGWEDHEETLRTWLADDPWPQELLTIESIRPWSVWLRASDSPASFSASSFACFAGEGA